MQLLHADDEAMPLPCSLEVPCSRCLWAAARDGLAPASRDLVFTLPGPDTDVPTLLAKFKKRSLDAVDLVALSGAHTARRPRPLRLLLKPPAAQRRRRHHGPSRRSGGRWLAAKCANDDSNAAQVLDVRTPDAFDNKYYLDLIAKQGLLKSDQGLMSDGNTNRTATRYALNQAAFFDRAGHSDEGLAADA